MNIANVKSSSYYIEKLDELFSRSSDLGEGASIDISGMIGQYAHGNEPSHHIAYLYSMAGQPWKTQKMVRDILLTQYNDQPNGLCGNEDCGQMSAWYVFSAMGFYPVNPADGNYYIGSPLFDKSSIKISENKFFRSAKIFDMLNYVIGAVLAYLKKLTSNIFIIKY